MFPSIVLLSWPLALLSVFSKYRVESALCFAVIGSYLLLPVKTSFDLPVLPKIDKHTLPILTAVLFVITAQRLNTSQSYHSGITLKHPIGNILIVLFMLSCFMTALTNSDPLFYPGRVLPALRLYDSLAMALIICMSMLVLVMAAKFLAHPQHQRVLILALVIAGLIYSVPTLFEIIMSPQLHQRVYGISNVDWLQTVRGDGFRPVVFLNHGLRLSLFLSLSALAALGASRLMGKKYRAQLLVAAGFLFLMLILSRSLGSLLVALALAPVVLFASARKQLLVAGVVASLVLAYPVLRGADMIPTDRILSFAEGISPQRAASLDYRFRNEDILLEKAVQRPYFGWGGYLRPRVFNENGVDISTTDGTWVISFGTGGWLRYLAHFGLLTAPLVLLAWRARKYDIGLETSVLALISTANLIDLIPNSGQTTVTWLVTGALWGRLAMGRVTVENDISNPDETAMQPTSRYHRRRGNKAEDDLSYSRSFKSKTDT